MLKEKYPSPFVIVGVGIPGSGKTTILKPYATELGAEYLCADDIRAELTGDEANQSVNAEAWDVLYERAKGYLGEEKSLVIDATQAQRRYRREGVEYFRGFGAKTIVAVCFDVPVQVALERVQGRERQVAEHVIRRMAGALEKYPVSLDDGFDDIIRIPS